MSEREILRRAKEVLLERGWHQGGYCADPLGDTGPVCLEGALRVVTSGGNAYEGSRDTWCTARVIAQALGANGLWAIPDWNDAPERTLDDVVGLIDRALGSLPAEAPEREKETVHA